MGGRREREGSGDRLWPPRPRGRGSATAAFARSCATTTSRRWRPSCGGPWGRASGTTSSCSATSAAPTANPRGFANLLWKQLDHLGNAGFDPALFRVDAYGNVLYLHADAASPLAWDVHHWFPCARGGRTVPSNLRIMQLQASRKKHNKLEFLVPWNRAFTFLFADVANEELSSLQAMEAHAFPHHFADMKKKVGLAPAAIVSARGSDSSVLKSVDANRPVSIKKKNARILKNSLELDHSNVDIKNVLRGVRQVLENAQCADK